jgi:hypothetical protein
VTALAAVAGVAVVGVAYALRGWLNVVGGRIYRGWRRPAASSRSSTR